MRKEKESDPLLTYIKGALAPGRFIPYGRSAHFVQGLEEAKDRLDALVTEGEAERAVRIYEVFLSGCYEKAEEVDDSGGDLGSFFEELFLSWIDAKQKAGCAPEETVHQVLGWMAHDNYGFCYKIEQSVAEILDEEGYALFKKHFEDQLESALLPFKDKPPKVVFEYPREVYLPALALKHIYEARKDILSYQALCERIVLSPKDCEIIANLYKGKRCLTEALSWVERGLLLEGQRQWGNESAFSLRGAREELLRKLGRGQEAFKSAWTAFQACPCAYAYEDLMKNVSPDEKKHWHKKAVEAAAASLPAFIEICTKTKEWDALADRVDSVPREELEQISHYVTEEAAKGLARHHASAAAKVYAALGVRILKSGKSQYYGYGLDHFKRVKKLTAKAGQEHVWRNLVDEIRGSYSRRSAFIGKFEKVVSGTRDEPEESFEERAMKRWKKQISE